MSRYNRPGPRSGTSNGRFKPTNSDPRMEWKPKIDRSLDSSSCSQNDNDKPLVTTGESFVEDVACEVKDLKQILNLLDDEDDDNSGRECVVEDVASEVKDFKQILNSLDEDDDDNSGSSKKTKESGDESENEEEDGRLKHRRFDICPKKVDSVVQLRPSLHAMNREKRNQNKQSMKGQNIKILRSGMVLMKGYISTVDQVSIVKTCREIGIGDGGFYQPGYHSGTKLHLQMMCLGKNWDPESHLYTELRSFDECKPPGIPVKFREMVEKAIQDSNTFIRENVNRSDEGKVVPFMSPDICIVNFYKETGRLGLHQDKDESEQSLKKGLPVVSFSIGDSAEFLYGETRAVDEADKVTLESGDVLIFGGKSRMIYHGVTSILPNTAPTSLKEATGMLPGRLNLTFRMY